MGRGRDIARLGHREATARPPPPPPNPGRSAQADFLTELSTLSGTRERPIISTSTSPGSRGGRTTSRGHTREKILDVDDLADLPRGRAIVFSSGNPATFIATEPWHTGPHAASVTASITAHDPAARADRPPSPPTDVHDARTTAQLREQWTRTKTTR